ncbi:hypothetical protein [Pseudodesulfovibrio sp.]|uniref:hypothetical protein n=1 Tax=unclassified Pseudodesulfovibrio TaxID=2661612 RepID=UPI003AFF6AAD
MSVRETSEKPAAMAHFPDGRYRWFVLHLQGEPYGWAAIAENGADLELHLTLDHWGPSVRRHVRGDLEWLKGEARRLGKERIVGMRIDTEGKFSPELFRFAGLFGFRDRVVLQTVALDLEEQ